MRQALRRVILLLAMLLSACAAANGHVVGHGDRYAPMTGAMEDYKLGVGDKVRIIVYRQDSLSGEFQVNPAGNLSFPLIGDIKAIGETISDVQANIHDKLAANYLRDPHVSVEMLAFRPFSISGEVKSPGNYPYQIGMTAQVAISSGGGLTPRADKRIVYIRKFGSGEEQLFRVTPDLRIWPGDTIRVPERLF